MTDKQVNKINCIWEHFGEKPQLVVAIEELSELQKELCKYLRGEKIKINLTEEIADVKIILASIIENLNISKNDVNEIIDYKLERTLEKVDEIKGKL